MIKLDETQQKIRELVLQENPANPFQYVKAAVKDIFLERINTAIMNCNDCDRCDHSVKSIGYGNPNATLLIIGESVSKKQLSINKESVYPFEGTDEEVLFNQMVEHYHLNKDEMFFVNAMNCFPCTKTSAEIIERPPGKKELQTCKIFLNNMIETVDPVAILLLGNITLNVFQNVPLFSNHGKIIDINGYPGIATYSLSYLNEMKNIDPNCFKEFGQDITELINFVKKIFPKNNLIKGV